MGTQGLIERNNLGIGNVNMLTTRYVLGYNMLYRLLTFMSKLNINLLFFLFLITILVITIKLKIEPLTLKELFVFVLLSFSIFLI